MEKKVEFGFGKGVQTISLPVEQILYDIEGRAAEPIADMYASVKEALANPIGTKPLKELVKPGEKVCLVVSDITRGWIRNDLLLPPLLDVLNSAGVPDENIFIGIILNKVIKLTIRFK